MTLLCFVFEELGREFFITESQINHILHHRDFKESEKSQLLTSTPLIDLFAFHLKVRRKVFCCCSTYIIFRCVEI